MVTFSIGKKIKLSALMISNPANGAHKDTKNTAKVRNEISTVRSIMFTGATQGDLSNVIIEHHATLIFMNTDGTWAFGMCNKYDETTNKVKACSSLYLTTNNS